PASLAARGAGEGDVRAPPGKERERYPGHGRYKLYDSFTYGLTYLAFDPKRPPFDNAKLRQALSRAVNKSEIVQVVFENKLAKVSCCPIAESIQGYDPKLKDFELGYDVAKAKAGLDELGYKAGADGLRA